MSGRQLSELEWLGWEVAAARYLEIGSGEARILRRIVERAPAIVSKDEFVRLSAPRGRDAATNDSRKLAAVRVHFLRQKLSTAYVETCRVREALSDIGSKAVIRTKWNAGYWMTADEADWLASVIIDSLNPKASTDSPLFAEAAA